MPHDLYDWLRRIKSVEREHAATRLATDRLLEEARRDPLVLRLDLSLRDVGSAAERLDGTYTIRLFAEFETGLRLYWPTAKGTDAPSRTQDLIDGIAATRRIPDDDRSHAHAVREYRNALVHEREEDVRAISLPDARSYLCRFFRFLPPRW